MSVSAAPENNDFGCRFAEGSGGGLTVTAVAAEQGPQCMEVIESALDGHTIAGTYNITFSKLYYDHYDISYKSLDEPVELVFQIPKDLQDTGRIFRMLYVSKGKVTVLEDMDSSIETITFRHDKAGAYALVYRDVPSSMPVDGEDFDSLMFLPAEPMNELCNLPIEPISVSLSGNR